MRGRCSLRLLLAQPVALTELSRHTPRLRSAEGEKIPQNAQITSRIPTWLLRSVQFPCACLFRFQEQVLLPYCDPFVFALEQRERLKVWGRNFLLTGVPTPGGDNRNPFHCSRRGGSLSLNSPGSWGEHLVVYLDCR